MKKFTIKLLGGTRINKWADKVSDALEEAERDYPNQVVGIEDKSPFNTVEVPDGQETK